MDSYYSLMCKPARERERERVRYMGSWSSVLYDSLSKDIPDFMLAIEIGGI